MFTTLLMLLSFLQLTGTDDISIKANEPKSYITCEYIFNTQLEQYNYFIESIKECFNNVDDITKALSISFSKYDINDVLLMHILFIKTQLDMMKERVPELEHVYEELYSELSLYGG